MYGQHLVIGYYNISRPESDFRKAVQECFHDHAHLRAQSAQQVSVVEIYEGRQPIQPSASMMYEDVNELRRAREKGALDPG
jgi:hypothetical protein